MDQVFPRPSSSTSRARDLADREYAEPLDLDRLAGAAGLSNYTFVRCFAATYGKTPALYLADGASSGPRTSCGGVLRTGLPPLTDP